MASTRHTRKRANKAEVVKALESLARRHPNEQNVGYFWKTSPNGRPKRWTAQDLALFRQLQAQERKKLLQRQTKRRKNNSTAS